MEREALGRLLRARRIELERTVREVAAVLQQSPMSVSYLERGEQIPRDSARLVQIARAYDLPLEAVVAAAAESAASKGAVELATRNVRPDTAEAAIALARSWPDLNPEQISAIRRVIEEGR